MLIISQLLKNWEKRGRISCVLEKISFFYVPLCILDFKTSQQYLSLILESFYNLVELRKVDII